MGRYKLLAIDMDGTLLNYKQEISSENRRWIQTAGEAGIVICISTGRGMKSAYPFIEELGLHTPAVTVNGSEVWKNPKEILIRHIMDLGLIRELHQLAVSYDTWFWAYSTEGMFNKHQWTDDMASLQWMKFGFLAEDDEVRQQIREILQSWGTLELTNSSTTNIEVNPAGISKASGLQKVCHMLGISMSDVVAIGDSLNDYTMIQSAGLGVAVANAQDEVLAVADLITLSNEEDGVAKVIKEVMLDG